MKTAIYLVVQPGIFISERYTTGDSIRFCYAAYNSPKFNGFINCTL
jgi:hypothetical protein